jgi:predicted nucleotide-binding protein
LNNEFLKGIQARERVVSLKKIIKTDSIQLIYYKDSLIPDYQKALDTAKVEIIRLDTKVKTQSETIKTLNNVLKGGLFAIVLLTIGLII